MSKDTKACIVLANGQIFEGKSFGAAGCITGEAVFTTGMNGYLETLTDPSYFGQIVIQTFPLIGNYGVIPPDFESAGSHVRGYIVRSWCETPSNFRNEGTIDFFLKSQNIIGLYDIDTRALTKVLREAGVMNAMLIAGDSEDAKEKFAMLKNPAKKAKLLKKIKSYKITNAVESVTCSAVKIEKSAKEIFKESALYRAVPVRSDGTKVNDMNVAMRDGHGKKVVLWDFGAKANIRRELLKRGLDVVTVPCTTTAAQILAENPDGVMLTNGPGDPEDNPVIIAEIKKIIANRIPIFGICLGHQLLALAKGAKTIKLKYGHRGANQPVKQLSTGRVYISSQNHGYAVKNETLPRGAVLSFVNTNDGTCEGITYTDVPAFSVQFHPEAASGPLDTNFLFDEFVRLITNHDYFASFKTTTKAIDAISYFASTIQTTKTKRAAAKIVAGTVKKAGAGKTAASAAKKIAAKKTVTKRTTAAKKKTSAGKTASAKTTGKKAGSKK
jgi:carbamoyl-phosphate synthase small subunit